VFYELQRLNVVTFLDFCCDFGFWCGSIFGFGINNLIQSLSSSGKIKHFILFFKAWTY